MRNFFSWWALIILVGCSATKAEEPAAAPGPIVKSSGFAPTDLPYSLEALRARSYPGSDLKVVQKLNPGVNYNRSIASYLSDGLTIYGLLTVPLGRPPEGGWPLIVFNHGHIPPEEYRTTERYVAYQDAFARAGYITFKSDYRGHGNSQGEAEGAYFAPGYVVDVLNALSSLKKLPAANPAKVGFWGHSMGGSITLKAMLVDKSIKVGVIWGGVIGSFADMAELGWSKKWKSWRGSAREKGSAAAWQSIVEKYGEPVRGRYNDFWKAVDPTEHLKDLSGPLQLDHGLADETVPHQLSERMYGYLQKAGVPTELWTYPGNDHNIAQSLNLALTRSLAFFDKYLK